MSFAAVLCFAAFSSVVHWTESKPAIKADVPGDRKYLVIGESVDRFLSCTAVDVPLADVILCLLTPIHFFQVNSHRDPRYRYRCETTPTNVTCAYSVSNVKETDAGLYICAVHNCGDVVHSDVHVFAYNKPLIDHIVDSTSNGTVLEGQAFFLTCIVNVPVRGTSGLSMQWRHNAKTIKSQSKFFSFLYSIQNANRSDSGRYSCVALNGTELDTSSLDIDITYPAKILTYLARTLDRRLRPRVDGIVYAETGENVTIECTVEGNPVPMVSLYHSKEVPVIERAADRTVTLFRNISRAEGKQDDGVYTCQANNRINRITVEKKINLFVYILPSVTFFDLVDENDTTGCRNVTVGEQRTLECRADGKPPPFVVILDEKGEQIANSSRNASYSFFATEEMDKMTYTCTATASVLERTANSTFLLCILSSTSSSSPIWWIATLISLGGLIIIIILLVVLVRTCLQKPNTLCTDRPPASTATQRQRKSSPVVLLRAARRGSQSSRRVHEPSRYVDEPSSRVSESQPRVNESPFRRVMQQVNRRESFRRAVAQHVNEQPRRVNESSRRANASEPSRRAESSLQIKADKDNYNRQRQVEVTI